MTVMLRNMYLVGKIMQHFQTLSKFATKWSEIKDGVVRTPRLQHASCHKVIHSVGEISSLKCKHRLFDLLNLCTALT